MIKGPHGGFYSEPRFHESDRMRSYYSRIPGPGQYRYSETAYRHLSSKHDLPPVVLGTGSRVKFPVKGFEMEFYGCQSPGPIYKPLTPPLKQGAGPRTAPRSVSYDCEPTPKERASQAAPGVWGGEGGGFSVW